MSRFPSGPAPAPFCAGNSACASTVFSPFGYIIGVAIAYLAQAPYLAPEWRLLIVTGFCGGLTTFSTFSAEVATSLQEGRFVWAAGAIGVHVIGSLTMTLAGLVSWQALKSL